MAWFWFLTIVVMIPALVALIPVAYALNKLLIQSPPDVEHFLFDIVAALQSRTLYGDAFATAFVIAVAIHPLQTSTFFQTGIVVIAGLAGAIGGRYLTLRPEV